MNPALLKVSAVVSFYYFIGVAEEAEARWCRGARVSRSAVSCSLLAVSVCHRWLRCVSGQARLGQGSGGGDTNCSRLHSGLIKTRQLLPSSARHLLTISNDFSDKNKIIYLILICLPQVAISQNHICRHVWGGEILLSVVTSSGQTLTDLTQTRWRLRRETENTNKIL